MQHLTFEMITASKKTEAYSEGSWISAPPPFGTVKSMIPRGFARPQWVLSPSGQKKNLQLFNMKDTEPVFIYQKQARTRYPSNLYLQEIVKIENGQKVFDSLHV